MISYFGSFPPIFQDGDRDKEATQQTVMQKGIEEESFFRESLLQFRRIPITFEEEKVLDSISMVLWFLSGSLVLLKTFL